MTSTAGLACRQCRAETLDMLGRIPTARVFAGQALEPPWPGGTLYRCRHCQLVFRHPVRSDEDYERLYETAPTDVWVSDRLRVDQRLVRDRIRSLGPAAKVLDVGCYDGSLLDALGPGYRKYGIEASAAAARKAAQRGIEIVGAKVRDIASIRQTFDVVCAIDVIEHMSQPLAFVETLASRLAPDGTLIVSTGASDAPAWRFAGGRYWYCGFPEHISFISPVWADAAARQLGLKLVDAERFTYEDGEDHSLGKQRRRFYRKVLQAKLGDALRAWLPGGSIPSGPMQSLARPGLFEDHILLCFKRSAKAAAGAVAAPANDASNASNAATRA